MSGIQITTSQNVNLEYEPAGVGYRILATMLDEIFKIVYAIILMFVFGLFTRNLFSSYDGSINYTFYSLLFIASLPYLLYYFLSESLMNGQSFGKKIIGTKVIKLDGTQASISAYIIRSLCRFIDITFSPLVAIIAVAATKKNQRIGDLAAGTTVIKLGSKVTLQDTILYKTNSDYKIVFEQVALLSDTNVAIVKQILYHAIQHNKKTNLELLARKIKAKMGVTTSLSNEVFLQTVLLDYSHYQFEK